MLNIKHLSTAVSHCDMFKANIHSVCMYACMYTLGREAFTEVNCLDGSLTVPLNTKVWELTELGL